MAETVHDLKAGLFKALASPVRIRIIEVLHAAGSLTVGEIQQRVGITSSSASQHLAVLREHALVTTRREGNSIWYRPAPGLAVILEAAQTMLAARLEAQARLLGRGPRPRRNEALRDR